VRRSRRPGADVAAPLDRGALAELAGLELRPAVSVLMPAHRAGPEIRQDPIRLKNLLREAERRLARRGIREDDAARVLAPAAELVAARAFWRHQQEGLAVFLAAGFARVHSAPRSFAERAVVGDRFHVVQLVPVVEADDRFYVLALSQNDVRLVSATPTTAAEVDLGDLPRNLSAALLEDTPERQIQSHVVSAVGGERGVIFHGHGGGMDDRKPSILQFFHRLDEGLRPHLGEPTAPLVLAAVEYLVPLYREANTHPNLLPDALPGNPEGLSAEVLQARGWEVVRPHVERDRAAVAERYRALAGTGRTADDIAAVLPAAQGGRIEHLFVAADAASWGTFDPASGTVALRDETAPEAEELVNLAVIHAWQRGGAVHVVDSPDVPGGGALAAILRY
jgi:hypothetical protein